jgi:hypothetical protein
MKTKTTEMFGLDTPIFAFSHCRDMAVLGTTRLNPKQGRHVTRQRMPAGWTR